MRESPKWLLHLFPSRDRTLWQRFVGILVTWGCPIMLWEIFQSGVLSASSEWGFFLALELPATVLGAFCFAVIEHLVYRWLPTRDLQSR